MQETGATGMNDMGPVMGRAMALAGGRAQGRELAPWWGGNGARATEMKDGVRSAGGSDDG